MQMSSSGPAENLAHFLPSGTAATLSSHQYALQLALTNPSQYSLNNNLPSSVMLSSTPMQRSLTNNPVMSSYSNTTPSSIATAASDSGSISVSVSSSFPIHSILMPTVLTPLSSAPSHFSTRRLSRTASASTTASAEAAAHLNLDHTVDVSPDGQRSQTQADDRIHFRLLDNIYFSTSNRQPRHDDDLGMDSPILTHVIGQPSGRINSGDVVSSDDEEEYMSDNAMDGVDYHHVRSLGSMLVDQRDGFGSFMFRTRSTRPELVEEEEDDDEDDDDDGIDQIIENRRQYEAHTFAMDMEAPPSPSSSRFERPQHAQLSPRSAAALTSIFSSPRTPWPQPVVNSSISSDLTAFSQQRARHEYDGNPYFRRPIASSRSSRDSIGYRGEMQSPLLSRNSIHDSQFRADESGLTASIRSRSASTQYDVFHQNNSAGGQLHLQGAELDVPRACGEVTPGPSMETRDDIWPMKFDMYYADGGEFNAAHSVENVLRNDTSVYCSRRSTNVNIGLKLAQPHQTFVLTQFKAKAPTTGYTAPCKEGLIFVSHEPISVEKTAIFDDMTREQYDQYMANVQEGTGLQELLKIHGASADAVVPAAFFQLEKADETCIVDLTPNRSGRYVLIKLLRSKCTNALQRPENIDLQYLGLIGFTGPRSFSSGDLL
ncbi:hypothetical protein EDD11_001563 [Mortierella claussenii]|nr:hypothetical protein EDD11_001563 [Mortierella claussenii]